GETWKVKGVESKVKRSNSGSVGASSADPSEMYCVSRRGSGVSSSLASSSTRSKRPTSSTLEAPGGRPSAVRSSSSQLTVKPTQPAKPQPGIAPEEPILTDTHLPNFKPPPSPEPLPYLEPYVIHNAQPVHPPAIGRAP